MSRIAAIALATLLLPAFAGAAAAQAERETFYERHFAEGFVANEQSYIVFALPAGAQDLRLEIDCNLHVGTFTVVNPSTGSVLSTACDGDLARIVLRGLTPGYYYGVASFTGVNGAVVRVTGVAG